MRVDGANGRTGGTCPRCGDDYGCSWCRPSEADRAAMAARIISPPLPPARVAGDRVALADGREAVIETIEPGLLAARRFSLRFPDGHRETHRADEVGDL